MEDTQVNELKARLRKQTRALAESESLVMQHIQRASDLEAALLACQQHSPMDMQALNAARNEINALHQENAELQAALDQAEALDNAAVKRLQEQIAALNEALYIAQQEKQVLEMGHFDAQALATAHAENDQLHEHIFELKAALQTATEQAKTSEQLLAVSQAEKAELLHHISQLEAIQAGAPQTSSVDSDALNEALNAARADVAHLHDQANQLREALHSAQLEKQALEMSGTDVSELRRRLELAEAHHLVEKRRNDSLQERLKELEQECARAYSYADNQEREVDKLTALQEDFENRLATLQHQNLQLRASMTTESKTIESKPAPVSKLPITATIPPLKLAETPTPSFDQRVQVLASSSAESIRPVNSAPRRVDLPVFLQRRA